MEGNRKANASGLPNNNPSQHAVPHSNMGSRMRVPTVHEALPFTPFSSIVPFTPEYIPPPLALPTLQPSAFAGMKDVQSARRALDQLSAGATNAGAASKRCQETLRDVQRLLDPGSLTQLHFKIRKPSHPLSVTKASESPGKPALSPFAKMVLANTDMDYRYVTSDKLVNQNRRTSWIKPQPREVSRVEIQSKPQRREVNGVEIQTNGHHITPNFQQRMVTAVLPTTLTPAERAEYQRVPENELSNATPSASRKHGSANGTRGMTIDQRQKGDQAVQTLQTLLQEIFEAEDQLEADTSGAISTYATEFFTTRQTDDGTIPVLRDDTQATLESCLGKVISIGRVKDIEVDSLNRVQRLCDGPAAAVPNYTFVIGEDWSDEDTEEWLSRLRAAKSGLTAARITMRIMIGGAQQKELQSEDFLRHVLDALTAVIERCIIPIVEEPPLSGEKIRGEKTQPPPNPKFQVAFTNRTFIAKLLKGASMGIGLLGELLVTTDFDETTVSQVQSLCKALIFAENSSNEKDSALGSRNFEDMRGTAMDVLAKIFAKHTDQREYIFNQILSSLDALPATKQSARQYKLKDGKPIQLVSALLMRLIQTSATSSDEALKLRTKTEDVEDGDGDEEESEINTSEDGEDTIKVLAAKGQRSGLDLISIAKPLYDAAQSNARYVVRILTQRAVATSKTSEEPYRKLLDIFTEDFINVLGSSEWPAAELLLRQLVIQMIQITDNEKNPVPARTLALEMLGTMGSAILGLQIVARDSARAIDKQESKFASSLCDLVAQLEGGNADVRDALAYDGPYRYVIQYLEACNTDEDAQLQTARGYHLTDWAFQLVGRREGSTGSDASEIPLSSKGLEATLKNMFSDPKWLDNQSDSATPEKAEGHLAALALTLNSQFCRAFNRIFMILLYSMKSEQSRVKSRSLISVVALLEKDASVLDSNHSVLDHIYRCAADSSPLVRDSALGLIDKCIALRPALNSIVYRKVAERTRDAATNVRKRALKMLKNIYLRADSDEVQAVVANFIISRIDDAEESVSEIARVTMEEIWFHPLYALKLEGEHSIKAKLAYASQASLLIKTIAGNDDVLNILEALLKRVLARSKTAEANVRVSKSLVALLFDGIVDETLLPQSPPLAAVLKTLTIFACASPTLFNASQLERLEPYTQNLSKTDNLEVYRSVLTILRNVMPHQTMMREKFLSDLQLTLLDDVKRLQKPELREVAPCLWTINGMLGNTSRLVKLMIVVMQKIHQMREKDLSNDERAAATLIRFMIIAGEFGNACNFGGNLAEFESQCNWSKSDSVPGLLVETMCPYTSPKRPFAVRVAALEAICTISQAWPKQFMREDVKNAFDTVFKNHEPALEEVILVGLEGFFIAQEVPDEKNDGIELGIGIATGSDRLGKTYVASDQDGASTGLAQRYLLDFLRIALGSDDDPAHSAARLVISINKQGMVHPKDCGPALVALETCPTETIAKKAFEEHRSQSEKYESLFEKEYMRGVQHAFEYQRDVIGDTRGYTGNPPTSKMQLTWDVLKGSKAQVRKKFLSNVAQKLDFEPSKLSITSSQHRLFVSFVLENLAFFEYDRVDDLLHLTSSLEKIFAGTGSTTAQAIESEVLKMHMDVAMNNSAFVNEEAFAMPPPQPSQTEVDPNRLLQLALSAQILCLIWETRSFLRRLWNMSKYSGKAKQQAKDLTRAPTRATNAATLTEAYFHRTSDLSTAINSEHAARSMCNAFVEIINVDSEVKVGDDEDAEGESIDDIGTPSDGSRKSPSLPPSSSGCGRKRKSSVSIAGTPRKRGRPVGSKNKGMKKFAEDEDDDEEGGWD